MQLCLYKHVSLYRVIFRYKYKHVLQAELLKDWTLKEVNIFLTTSDIISWKQ